MGDYVDPVDDREYRANALGYHPPADDAVAARHAAVRAAALAFSDELVRLCPSSRERSLAWWHVRYAMMLGNAAIAVHDSGPVAADPTKTHRLTDVDTSGDGSDYGDASERWTSPRAGEANG